MLDKNHVVDVPNGAIVRSNRIVLWTVGKNYIAAKQYNEDVRRMIGKTLATDKSKMYPNDNFKELFPDLYAQALKPNPAPSHQVIGYYAVMNEIANALPLYKILCEVFGKEDADLVLDYAMYQIAYESAVAQDFEDCMKDKALFSETLRSDSYLSTFFRGNLSEDKIDQFYERWSEAIIKHKDLQKVYLNVDGSNIDCEAEGVTLKEKGHDKSGQGTTIVNMMYAVGSDGTPVTCHQYRGSVIDQRALKYMIRFFSHTKAKVAGFCVDRGTCSKANTDMLRENGLEFVMMMTNKPKGFSEARDQLRDSIRGKDLLKNNCQETYLVLYCCHREDDSMTIEKEQEINLMAFFYNGCADVLDEAQRRIMIGQMAIKASCRGALAMLSKLTGVAFRTIKRGIKEVLSGVEHKNGQVRLAGGGRKSVEAIYPDILRYVQAILDEATYGSPESGRRWTNLSQQDIADALKSRHGICISANTAGRLIEKLGYSKQANKKMNQVGEPHPDRDAQFQFLDGQTQEFLDAGDPVISVDTKKKENIGNFKNDGREYRQSKDPRLTNAHDFTIPELGKVCPYGVYLLNDNIGFVNLGTSADTSEFAVESIRRWLKEIGSVRFPNAGRLLIHADCGGSNRANGRLWRMELAKLAMESGIAIHVIHTPPGTSKWNKVEHRLFCYITKNWQGKPLVDVQTVISLISSTSTKTGLQVFCQADWNEYVTGLKVSDEELETIDIEYVGPHKGWSYIIRGFKIDS